MGKQIDFTKDQIDEICRLYIEDKEIPEEIGKLFNCSRGTIERCLKRKKIKKRTRLESLHIRHSQKDWVDPKNKRLIVNRVGKKIGEFLVKKHIGWRTSPNGENHALYEVECSCGNIKTINQKELGKMELKEKKLKIGEGSKKWRLHCNDHPHHVTSARVGDRLSYLEVIDLPRNTGQLSTRKFRNGDPRDGIGNFLIACICHAPNKKCKHKNEDNPKFLSYRDWDSRVKNVEDGKKTSCGCWSGVSHGLILSEDRMDNLLARLFYAAKSRAKEEKRPINIDPEYMKSLELPKYCPILGIPIDYYAEERHDGSPSLDKFYPRLGYIKGNVQIISWRANRIKSDGSPEEWEKIAEWCKKEDVRMRLKGKHPGQNKKS